MLGKSFLVLAIVLSLGLAAIVVGCEGDDELTLEEYFDRFQKISDERTAEIDSLGSLDLFLDEDDLDGFRDAFKEAAEISDKKIAEVADLNAPSEAAHRHNEFVSAGQAMFDELDKIIEAMEDADTLEEVIDVMIEAGTKPSEFSVIEARFDDACWELQGVAEDAGIDVDLECSSDEDEFE
ncbi:MAG TPA: hypothetical protein QGF35_00100 [Dehalococcoidia bacterium]|nr:hypothetical protein [Dehalococcoidia bacterium]